jgi:aspartate-semialdehyde dehydrogenase
MKIAILGIKTLLATQLLRFFEETNNVNFDLECFDKKKNEKLVFNNRCLEIRDINTFSSKYDLVIDCESHDAFENNPEQIKLTHVNASIIVVTKFLNAIKKMEIKKINLTDIQSISTLGREAMDVFFREVKLFSTHPLKQGLFLQHPMAFNVIPALEESERLIYNALSPLLNDAVVSCVLAPVAIGNTTLITFECKHEAKESQIIHMLAKHGIVYSHNLVTPTMMAHDDYIAAIKLRQHNAKTWSIALIYDNLRVEAKDLFDRACQIIQNKSDN